MVFVVVFWAVVVWLFIVRHRWRASRRVWREARRLNPEPPVTRGWVPDPASPGSSLYWNGVTWVEQAHAIAAGVAPPDGTPFVPPADAPPPAVAAPPAHPRGRPKTSAPAQADRIEGEDGPLYPWLDADANPFGIRVLDVRALTQTMISTTGDPGVIARFAELRGSDGSHLWDQHPEDPAESPCELDYPPWPIEAPVLFRAQEMEDKWDVFLHGDVVFVARSWTGQLVYRATLAETSDDGRIHLTALQRPSSQDAMQARRSFDFIVRSHVFGWVLPHPIDPEWTDDDVIALASFSAYGRRAVLATHEDTTEVQPLFESPSAAGQPSRREVELRAEHDGADHRYLTAWLDDAGNLHIDGQDLGPATAMVSGDGEYEWFQTIAAADLPRLRTLLDAEPGGDLLDLLEARWSGAGSYDLERILREGDVPVKRHIV